MRTFENTLDESKSEIYTFVYILYLINNQENDIDILTKLTALSFF